jgi:hypothetical protein
VHRELRRPNVTLALRGIDGHVYFKPDGRTTEKAIVSVKGGENVNVAMVRDLAHVVDRQSDSGLKGRIGGCYV